MSLLVISLYVAGFTMQMIGSGTRDKGLRQLGNLLTIVAPIVCLASHYVGLIDLQPISVQLQAGVLLFNVCNYVMVK